MMKNDYLQLFEDKKLVLIMSLPANNPDWCKAAFEAGADVVTVLAVTDSLTMRACVETADRCGGRIVADMICVDDIPAKVEALEEKLHDSKRR